MKRCISCGEALPPQEFYAHPRMADGRLNKCKSCCRAYEREKRAADPVAAQAKDAAQYRRHHAAKRAAQAAYRRTVAGKAALARGSQGYRDRHPEKRAAHIALGNALRSGKVTRPAVCEGCGAECRPHGHHDDYARPLDVRWLCVACHEVAHHGDRALVAPRTAPPAP